MNEYDFEGTLVLEKLASIEQVDAFFAAVDSDDFNAAKALMKKAGVEPEMIEFVLSKMSDVEL